MHGPKFSDEESMLVACMVRMSVLRQGHSARDVLSCRSEGGLRDDLEPPTLQGGHQRFSVMQLLREAAGAFRQPLHSLRLLRVVPLNLRGSKSFWKAG